MAFLALPAIGEGLLALGSAIGLGGEAAAAGATTASAVEAAAGAEAVGAAAEGLSAGAALTGDLSGTTTALVDTGTVPSSEMTAGAVAKSSMYSYLPPLTMKTAVIGAGVGDAGYHVSRNLIHGDGTHAFSESGKQVIQDASNLTYTGGKHIGAIGLSGIEGASNAILGDDEAIFKYGSLALAGYLFLKYR